MMCKLRIELAPLHKCKESLRGKNLDCGLARALQCSPTFVTCSDYGNKYD
jgi:hypothetical protein